MTTVKFEGCNCKFRPPAGLVESQVMTVDGYVGQAQGGSLDGVMVVVVAWLPNEAERAAIVSGAPIYLSSCGGLMPHFLTTSFDLAVRPA